MRLKLVKRLGKGSYGLTCLCTDESGKKYTVKFFLAKSTCMKEGVYGQMNIKEIDFLVSYRHPNINSSIKILTEKPFVVKFDDKNKVLDKYCAVYDYAESDLDDYISSNIKRNVRDIMYQILSGIYFLHIHNIIHRDIKPGNILMFSEGKIKITDFGLSKFDKEVNNKHNSLEAGTYGYMSPEMLLREGDYDISTDIWSCGCVLITLVKGNNIFSNKSEDKSSFISEMINKVSEEKELYYKTEKELLREGNKRSFKNVVSLTREEKIMVGDIDQFYDLLDGMLSINSKTRFTALECLSHPFFTKINVAPQNELRLSYQNHNRIIDEKRNNSIKIFETFIQENPAQDYRVVFQALNMFDRILLKKAGDKYNTDLLTYITLYISYKYFNTHSYESIYKLMDVPKKYTLIMLEKVEIDVTENYLCFEIYRPTTYDILQMKKLNHTNVLKLFHTMAYEERIIGKNIQKIANTFSGIVETTV